MAGPGDLYDLLAEYLEACAEAVAAGPGGAIGRSYVSPGAPAWDCEQLTVHAGGPSEADTLPVGPPLAPGHRAFETGAVHLVNMTATVLRCVPVAGKTRSAAGPSPAQLGATAERTLGDLWAIWNHLRNLYRQQLIFWPDGSQRELFFDPAVTVPIEGGLAGWQIPIRVALDGYREL